MWLNNVTNSHVTDLFWSFVRVRLGLPTYNRTEPDDPWGLDEEYTLLSDFRLKSDGSLDLRRVKEHWNLSAVLVSIPEIIYKMIFTICIVLQVLDPGRYECFEPADENYLSHFAIGVLSMRDGFITVVGAYSASRIAGSSSSASHRQTRLVYQKAHPTSSIPPIKPRLLSHPSFHPFLRPLPYHILHVLLLRMFLWRLRGRVL